MLEKIISFLKKYNDLEDIVITGESELIADLGLSSYELVEMCGRLEEELDIEIDDENFPDIVTVNDVAEYLKTQQELVSYDE